MPETARRKTLPPSPPSPPSGPPRGTNFSRRKLVLPRPPLPACTLSRASSTNFIVSHPKTKTPAVAGVFETFTEESPSKSAAACAARATFDHRTSDSGGLGGLCLGRQYVNVHALL